MADIVLKGITWNHSRGITPLMAAAQRFTEQHPGIEIQWHKRSLQQFADFPIEQLTEQYDLLIIDHPWVGTAAATKCVLALDEYLSAEYLTDQLANSVGPSHASYNYGGHQWALAIDAATPVASYRKDLFAAANAKLPQTWEEVIELAKVGKVAVPAIPIDLLMNFYTFCIAQGGTPFESQEEIIPSATGKAALQMMNELYSNVDRSMFNKNPIAVAELMSQTDDYWYCPFAYGYSNYSRIGYAKQLLEYGMPVRYNEKPLRTTIGGTGLSVSAFSKHKQEAVAFAEMVCSPSYQTNGYIYNEGQPGYLKAWTNDLNNQLTHHFFKNTLPAMEHGFLRPRYHGYLHFQDEAGAYVQEYLLGKQTDENKVLEKMNRLYIASIEKNRIKIPA
ncbi:ABC transporter substrate-binding protein [Niabella insulamsoli]|uniref:ABC transporter substrate-binding protein n=1 Tax=Niabella insulamsoli TaxID=3144874 RepID=UPI0031FCCE77